MALHFDSGTRVQDETPRRSGAGAAHGLTNNELRIAVAALDAIQFVLDSGLRLISLWGVLEALFSPAIRSVLEATT